MNPPKPKGIDFADEEIRQALENNQPLMLWLDYGNSCDLNCRYCFNAINKSQRREKSTLTLEDYIEIIKQAKDVGIKTIFIAGEGEPTLDKKFWQTLPLMKQSGITPIIFTNGYHLTREQIEVLYKNGATVGIKINSFNSEIQDFLAGKQGYTKKRDETLRQLIKQGFAKERPTRLWLDTLVCKQNYDEIPKLFRYARENNIWPGVNTFLHMGSGANENIQEQLDVSIEQIKDLWKRLSNIDKEQFDYEWIPRPPYAAWECNFYFFSLMIDNKGRISKCLGTPKVANIFDSNGKIRKDAIIYAWNHPKIKPLTHITKLGEYYGCPCRRCLKHGEHAMLNPPSKDIWQDNI